MGFLGACTSQQDDFRVPIPADSSAVPWTHLELNSNPDRFQFAIVTDRTGGARPGVFEEAIEKLNLLNPPFVVSVGDLIEGYTEDRATVEAEWDDFDAIVRVLRMPFFYLPGNHDYTNAAMADIWHRRYGPAYYHFVHRDVLFLMLNSEDPLEAHKRGAILDEQFEWARGVLERHRGVRWTLVFVHQPLWRRNDTGRWPDLERLLQDRTHTVFAGHFHNYMKHVRHDRRYFVLATTGGASSLRGPNFGEFDHVVWVTMTDEGPVLANLLLDGIWDENVRDERLAKRMDELLRGLRIEVEPLIFGDALPRRGALKVRLLNDTDLPMRFTARFRESPLLVASGSTELEVEPNTIETVEVPFGLSPGADLDAHPLMLDERIGFTMDGRPPVLLARARRLGVRLPAGSWLLEAKTMRHDGYQTRFSSNGKGIIELPSGDARGTAAGRFGGEGGTYDLTMVVVPESDGNPRARLVVAGKVMLDERYPREDRFADLSVDEARFEARGVAIRRGDEIRIEGTADGSAYARVDCVVFTPAAR